MSNDGIEEMKGAIARRRRSVTPPSRGPLHTPEEAQGLALTTSLETSPQSPQRSSRQIRRAQSAASAVLPAEGPVATVGLGLRVRVDLRRRLQRCAFELEELAGERVTQQQVLEALLAELPDQPGPELEELRRRLRFR